MNVALRDVQALAAALAAAEETGLIAALAQHPASATDLSARCSIDARACACVLDVFEAFDLTSREGDRYRVGPELIERSTRPLPLGEKELELWQHAPIFLRTGTPLLTMDAAPEAREQIYRDVVSSLGSVFAAAADHLAGRCDLTPGSILDLGCGSGVWSLAIARRLPSARVTGLDLPSVVDQFRARAAALGIDYRIDTIEGDMHSVALPDDQWELAIIANVLRLEPVERARALIKRGVAALRPGGSLLIVDALASGSAAAERARAVYGLHLAMRTHLGRVHTAGEIRQWMEQAGCEPASEIVFDERLMATGALGALVARKKV